MWSTVSAVMKGVLFGVPVAITFTDLVAQTCSVSGRSMQPCLNPTELRKDILLLRPLLNYEVARGDIVIIKDPDNPEAKLVKRVISLPGDKVIARSGKKKGQEITIPPGHCWVEGDNAAFSRDSNKFGAVSLGLITARAVCIIWPPDRWRRLNVTDYQR